MRIHASSLNQGGLDYLYGKPFLTRMGVGLRKPRRRLLGFDAAGQVEAMGNSVTGFAIGDAVFGDMTQFGHGAFAEYACAPARSWAPIPVGMSYQQAATLPQAAVLAAQGLRGRGGIAPGSRVLINGASGSVGPFAVQIAKALGAHVTGVCSTAKQDMVRELGADEVIDYTLTDYTLAGPQFDWILDVAGNHSIFHCTRALKPGAVYVMVGGSTKRIAACAFLGPLFGLISRKKIGILWWQPFRRGDVAFLRRLTERGKLSPVIDKTYPLAELPAALSYLDTGSARGKVVISSSREARPAIA